MLSAGPTVARSLSRPRITLRTVAIPGLQLRRPNSQWHLKNKASVDLQYTLLDSATLTVFRH
jgi:hypothetical protein